LLAIGLGYYHFQVAAIARGVQVVDLEFAGRHRGFVDDVAVLAHADTGIAGGNAPHRRRVAPLRLGVHAVVAGQFDAAHAHAFKHGAVRKELAHCQLAFNAAQRALHRRLYALILGPGWILMVQTAAMAQPPGPRVDSAVDAHIALPGRALATIAIPINVGVVAQHAGGNAVVPVLRVDIAARAAHEPGLRY